MLVGVAVAVCVGVAVGVFVSDAVGIFTEEQDVSGMITVIVCALVYAANLILNQSGPTPRLPMFPQNRMKSALDMVVVLSGPVSTIVILFASMLTTGPMV